MAIGKLERQPRKGEHGIVVCLDPYCHFCFPGRWRYMEISDIVTLITNVGFPIACTCTLFYFWNKEREEHRVETSELKDAINNNTIVIQKLMDKFGGDEN